MRFLYILEHLITGIEMLLSNFCRIWDNALSNEVCDKFITLYNENSDLLERLEQNHYPCLTQLDFTKHKELDSKLHDYMIEHAFACLGLYKNVVKEARFWPEKFSFENFRIKHYKEGGHDRFDEHVDSCNYDSSKRFFSFFWYLNDVEKGGETEFTNLGIKIEPKKGRLLTFPPLWMFPHTGNPVIKGEKYILHTYLHYDQRY